MQVKAPHTGVIWQHCVSEGQKIEEGQDLIASECMKLEMIIAAPCTGTVIWLKPMGESFEEGDHIATIEEK